MKLAYVSTIKIVIAYPSLATMRNGRSTHKLHSAPQPDYIVWLLHNLVEASTELFRYLLLGGSLKPWELHLRVSSTSKVNLKLL